MGKLEGGGKGKEREGMEKERSGDKQIGKEMILLNSFCNLLSSKE